MKKIELSWDRAATPVDLRSVLTALGEDYPIVEGKGRSSTRLVFEKIPGPGACEVRLAAKSALVRYSTPAQAGRAIGALLSGLVKDNGVYSEQTPFTTLGIMLDCSRNAVITTGHIKTWMRRLALLGYNMIMLYTEDTYELPGEPWFGYQRGAYTAKELKEIDDYAEKLNIEIIPCIQTLGHLEKILRHSAYWQVKDTGSVLMVGEEKTYELIDKMIGHWKRVCRSNRIHIGMDETHDIGRGRYLDLHGYRDGFSLFNEHLARVVKLCRKHGLKPMIWSDMYFRLGSKTMDYYDTKTVIPRKVIQQIPRDAELVYWDYYHDNKEFYLDWIARHRKMGGEPLVGSGIWTWGRYWYDHATTQRNAGACIEACYEAKVKELFFTQWGDDGAYCDHDSAFAGMVYCADRSYGDNKPADARLEKRFKAICGGSYAAHLLASGIHGGVEGIHPDMWADPFYDTPFRRQAGDDIRKMAAIAKGFAALAGQLKKVSRDRSAGDLKHACAVASAFAARYSLFAALLSAYRKKDKRALCAAARQIPVVAGRVAALEASFRNMWLNHNKPQGIETIQARFGMLRARYREIALRIGEYVRGEVSTIPELDGKPG